ncbi:hypothetical protein L1987_67339 [Smallanthus sonchifolius]|uniref:Uncharacterized protein n=1 Tax=Smallanthus sonchifolius TaxID=185202 RepID=A0ACB9B2P8_9ASTR|nr:hypothetical protein L1987_67339 [Smallanthus sonchifolius]
MESGLRSRKRKQRPTESDSFGGIFTRSRSQIYFHRHRSGYARSDSNRIDNLIKSRANKEQSEATVNQITSQVSVKDLRARRVFSPATIADDAVSIGEDLDADFDGHKKNDAGDGDFRVSEPTAVDLQASSENIVDASSFRENNAMEADVAVQMTPTIAESEHNKRPGEKHEIVPVAVDLQANSENIVVASTVIENNVMEFDVAVQMTPTIAESEQNKRPGEKHEMIPVANEIADTKMSMSKSQSLGCCNKFARSKEDLFSFEIVDAALPKVVKSSNTTPNMVALKDEEIGLLSNSSKLADGAFDYAKSSEKQMNDGLISTVEGSDVVQKSQEDALNDTEECVQMTPPDSVIHSKSKTDDIVGVLALKSCSRKRLLQTPTSFSHRRLLPFLMSVAGGPLNQSLKLEKAIEQNQQQPTQSFLHQDEKLTTTDETSNSPTSTLIPVDTPINASKAVSLVLNDNILDASGLDKEGSGSILQLEVNLQSEDVKSGSCIKLEQSPPKINLKCVEEATSKATPLCIEQSYSENRQILVKESPHQYLLPAPEVHVENIKNGILKRTPRGCRGICNCLNCTSFRLHAERSFEFSKNQMHDAEEVALELINDLTCLRSILETTSSSSSLDTAKEKQVKEACAEALYKEQVARARLAQMNEDLSIHCRSMNLLRPKVTFANKIEKKVISKDETYEKKTV